MMMHRHIINCNWACNLSIVDLLFSLPVVVVVCLFVRSFICLFVCLFVSQQERLLDLN